MIIILFKRFFWVNNEGVKDLQERDYPDFYICEKHYSPSFLINHKGKSIEEGHYEFIDIKSSKIINDDKIFTLKQVDKKDIYMAIYEVRENQ